MSTPKSVVKVKKNKDGAYIEYTSNVDQIQYYIHELSRAALRDVGKYIRKAWNIAYYNVFHKNTGEGGRATTYQVIASPKTEFPRVRIGLPHSYKGKEVKGFYSYFQEFGTSKTPKLGLLTNTVQNNIAEIVKIESQYLSGLSGEVERLESLVDEADYIGEEDE